MKNPKLVQYVVLSTFFAMGCIDLVGLATGYVKSDFKLSLTTSQLLPSLTFVWFALFSIPIGAIMNKIGQKNTMLAGLLFTAVGLLLPIIHYSFPLILAGFVLLGIGNTIIQVSANPLLKLVIAPDKISSKMSLGQFIKAIASLCGPLVAGWFALQYGHWQYVLYAYGIMSALCGLLLYATPIQTTTSTASVGIKPFVQLIKKPNVQLFILSIFFIVGIDVSINSTIASFVSEKFNLPITTSSLAISLYFFSVMAGRLLGTLILSYFKPAKVLVAVSVLALASSLALVFSSSLVMLYVFLAILGLASSLFFPVVFAIALTRYPQQANEISGILVMSISGGAIFPLLMGVAAEAFTLQWAILAISIAIVYILGFAVYLNKLSSNKNTNL